MAAKPSEQATRRERGKADRRERILEATYDLLREVGREALSMRMVAERADVAVSTVYNLFESKQAILSAMFDMDLERFKQDMLAGAPDDALERIFHTVSFATELYRADPRLQRALLSRPPGSDRDTGLDAAYREPRIRFWRDLVYDAIRAGQLKPMPDPRVLAILLVHIFSGAIDDWIANAISVDRLREETHFGFAVVLSSFAIPPHGAALRRKIVHLERSLA
jgi:AcrR family transcriptional regulator